jgi:hypothetical protein
MQALANVVTAMPARKALQICADSLSDAFTWVRELAEEVRKVRSEALKRMP